MNEKLMCDILLIPYTVKICKQDPNGRHEAHFCDCESCRDYDRYEDCRQDWLMEKHDSWTEEES